MIPIILVAPIRLPCSLGQFLQGSRIGRNRLVLAICQLLHPILYGVQVLHLIHIFQRGLSPALVLIPPVTGRPALPHRLAVVVYGGGRAAAKVVALLLIQDHIVQMTIVLVGLHVKDPLAGLAALGGDIWNGEQEVGDIVVQREGVARLFPIFTLELSSRNTTILINPILYRIKFQIKLNVTPISGRFS